MYDYDTTAGDTDVIRLAADVLPSDVVVWRGTNDLYLSIGALTGSEDRIAISNWFTNTANRVERIEFADGTVWGEEKLALAPMLGTTGNDYLYGTVADDLFDGGGGNDTVYGYGGRDVLDGGSGNDTLYAVSSAGGLDSGDDVYLFGRGSGRDTVYDYDTTAGNTDVIRLAADVLPSDVVVWRGTNDLYLSIGALTGSEDRIAITNWFTNTANRIERIEFADGTVWGAAVLGSAPILGTANAEALYGSTGDDLFDGGAGNDTLYGNNTSTGTGNDTYLLKRGNGQDTIVDSDTAAGNLDTIRAVGLLPSEVTLGRDTYGLILKINGTTDQMTVNNWFGSAANRVERVVFDDGTVWDATTLAAAPILGTANAEALYGSTGDDLFDGGAGNDTLYGNNTSIGTGNDTYLLKRGNGQDTIVDYDTVAGNLDTIRAVGLLPSEVTLGRDTYSLILKINGTTDQMTVNNWFGSTASRVERVVFDDGTVWDTALLATAPILGTTGNDTLYGTAEDDLFDGGTGNDMLYGYTGSGYDSGNDTYLLKRGNGQDTISDYGSTAGNVDTVKIVGTLPSDMAVSRRVDQYGNLTNDLVLKINGTPDQLTLQNYFVAGGAYKVEKVQFDDGTVWTPTDLDGALALPSTTVAYGTSGADAFDLRNVANTAAYGYTSSGYDSGNDTYLFGAGAGQDTISDYGSTAGNVDTVKIVGKLPSDIAVSRRVDASGSLTNDLVLKINGTTDQLTLQNYFVAGGAYKVEKVQFDDGTVWTPAELDGALALPSTATAYGTSGADGIDLRNSANTAAYGYISNGYDSGNDTYLFGAGAGQDTVSDYGSTAGNVDTVKIVGKLPSDIAVSRRVDQYGNLTNDLVLKINGTPDQLTLQNYFVAGSAYKVEKVQFGDGTVWTPADLDGALALPSTTVAYGTSGADGIDLRNSANTTAYGYTSSGYDSGNDTYLFGAGAGQDTISDYGSAAGNVDTVKIVGRLPSDIAVSRRVDQYGNLTNDLVLKINGTPDQLTLQNYFVAGGAYKVEKVQFDDGTVWDMALLGSAAIMGTAVANTLSGSADSDLIQGLGGNDTLSGNAGNDIMQGGADNDTISDTSGNNLFDGGAGIDILTGGAGKELFIGGGSNDTITTGTGADLIAFNRGDGQDVVNASTGADNTLSLGGGIRYTDLSFSKSANDLVLGLGNAEQITLKDWYATGANNKSVLNLQMVAEAMADFDSTSSDPLRNNKVETFNFGGLADRFDQARAADSTLTNWSLTNALLDFHLSGSDTDALGGDLAYQYGKTGILAGLGVTPVQSVLSHAQFATTPQTLQPLATLQEGIVKLG